MRKMSWRLAVKNAKSGATGSDLVAKDSGDVLNQLWRVLNTDISWSKSANASKDPKAISNAEAKMLATCWDNYGAC